MTEEKEKHGLFVKLYDASKEALKTIKKPLVKRSLKRKFESARDSALAELETAEEQLQTARESFDGYDINAINKLHAKIDAAKTTIKYIEKEYQIMFNEKLEI